MLHLLNDGSVYEPAPAGLHGSDNLSEPPADRARQFAGNVGVLHGLKDEHGKSVWTLAKMHAAVAKSTAPGPAPEPKIKLNPWKQVLLALGIIAVVTVGAIVWNKATSDKPDQPADAPQAAASAPDAGQENAPQAEAPANEAPGASAADALPGQVTSANPTCTGTQPYIPVDGGTNLNAELCTVLNTKEPQNTFSYAAIDTTPDVVSNVKNKSFLIGENLDGPQPANGEVIVINKLDVGMSSAYVIVDEDSLIQVNTSAPDADINKILASAGFAR